MIRHKLETSMTFERGHGFVKHWIINSPQSEEMEDAIMIVYGMK
jgi:hypothetical protein